WWSLCWGGVELICSDNESSFKSYPLSRYSSSCSRFDQLPFYELSVRAGCAKWTQYGLPGPLDGHEFSGGYFRWKYSCKASEQSLKIRDNFARLFQIFP